MERGCGILTASAVSQLEPARRISGAAAMCTNGTRTQAFTLATATASTAFPIAC